MTCCVSKTQKRGVTAALRNCNVCNVAFLQPLRNGLVALTLRAPSRLRTRLRIAASIVFVVVLKGFFVEKGLFFHGKGASRRSPNSTQTPVAPPPPPALPTPPFLETTTEIFSKPTPSVNPPPCGEGPGGAGVRVEFGERASPFTVKKRPLFDEKPFLKAFSNSISPLSRG